MPTPELEIVAEGDLATGEHWILRAGGSATSFSSMLETVHPDGHRDTGGMGGPVLPAGQLLNTYTGGSDRGLRRVLARADLRVARLRLELRNSPPLHLDPVGHNPNLGVVFFAALLPRTVELAAAVALDAQGHVLEPQDLARHQHQWQRWLHRDDPIV